MERLFIVLVVVALAFILVTRFIEDATIKLIFQVILGAVLIYSVLRFAGVLGS